MNVFYGIEENDLVIRTVDEIKKNIKLSNLDISMEYKLRKNASCVSGGD